MCAETSGPPERYPLSDARERWPEFLLLEHETLPGPVAFERDGDELFVRRRTVRGRPIRNGRVPREVFGDLLLQAAAAAAFFQVHGYGLDEEDVLDARWERSRSGARLELARSPAALRRTGPVSPAAAVVSAMVDALARRGGRIADARTRDLASRLAEPEARLRRAEHAVVATLASFPELALPERSGTRARALGYAGELRRDARSRARIEAARALLSNRSPRVFVPSPPSLVAGGALGLQPPPSGAADASRRIRELAETDARSGRAVWIAAALEEWDSLSRRSFEAASRFLPAEIEVRVLPARPSAPRLPDEWRREVFVPCGSIGASLRFYEWLSERGRDDPAAALRLARACVESAEWCAFASDPTGNAPLPRIEGESAGRETRTDSNRAVSRSLRRRAARESAPDRKIDLWLEAGDVAAALEAAKTWCAAGPPDAPERWFDLSARLAASCTRRPAWLELLEAEREVAGGRPRDARIRWQGVAADPGSAPSERRSARLRDAEVCAGLLGASESGRLAASWRADFPDAPPLETLRALRLEASGLARDGRRAEAYALLEEADRLAAPFEEPVRLENALVRAGVLSLDGKLEDEARLFDRWRAAALACEPALAARFVSREALSLCDRREFAAAAARLEEAVAILRDDPSERARLLIDLAATRYHAGMPERCGALLEEAAALAASAGRRDLLRLARGNRVELAISRGDWDLAAGEIDALLAAAERDGDDVWRLVGWHQRGRLSLRRGLLDAAGADNARARQLAERLGDRLEIGELWLEEGDRCALLGDVEGARRAWERAAADPPDRCDSERRAAERLRELSWLESGGPPDAARASVLERLARGDYEAAETAARWNVLFGDAEGAASLAGAARRVLSARGGGALADAAFGENRAAETIEEAGRVRELREALARGLAGEDASDGARAAGIAGLRLADADGRDLLRLGDAISEGATRVLEAGNARYLLTLSEGTPDGVASAAALILETLLFRLPPTGVPEGFAEGWRRFGVVTQDASMEEPYRRLRRFASQSVTVLVRGESGSGKEAVARAVHALSPRASGPFVPVNVPAIPAALLESELFGHVRGAFTGAERDRVGLFEEAARGTIFFDEIGDLDPSLQAKLLRVLQDREIRRVGENRSRRIDVRVVSATSRDLSREVELGRFREDLYYRLHVAVIALPPLRDRGRDALELARHFLSLCGREYGRAGLRLSPESAAAIAAHGWPGNVRELQNAIAQAAALADADGVVAPSHLPETVRRLRSRSPSETYRSRLDAHRRDMISDALERAGGNRSRAARDLGLSRQALRYLIKELKVPAAATNRRRAGDPPEARLASSVLASETKASRRRLALLLAAACVIPFADGLGGAFTYDDKAIVRDDPRIRSIATIDQLFDTPYFGGARGSGSNYRPLLLLSFAVQWWIHGGNVYAFHAVNVLLHAAVTLLLWRLWRRLGIGEPAAFAACLLFAAHPLHVEAVTSLVGRGETQAALLCLVFLDLALTFTESSRRRALLVAAAVFAQLLALLTKESAAAAPLLAFVLFFWREGGTVARRLATAFWTGLPLWVGSAFALLATFALRAWVLGGWIRGRSTGIFEVENPLAALRAPARVANASLILLRYAGRAFFPLRLSADESAWAIRPVRAASVLGVAAVLLLGVALAGALRRRDTPLALGFLFFVVAFLPASNLLFPIGTIFAERVAYLPSAGLCLIAAAAIASWPVRARGPSRAPAAVLVAATVLLAVRTAVRNTVWWSDEELFENSVTTAPDSSKNHYNLGWVRAEHARFREGRAAYRRATEIYSDYWDAWAGKGRCERALGRLADARRSYERSLQALPSYENGFFGLGLVLEDSGKDAEAAANDRRGLSKNPRSLPLSFRLATVSSRLRDPRAGADWKRALEIGPTSLTTRLGYAEWLWSRGERTAGRRELARVLRSAPRWEPALRAAADENEQRGFFFGEALARERLFRETRTGADLARLLIAARRAPGYRRRFDSVRESLERRSPWAFRTAEAFLPDRRAGR